MVWVNRKRGRGGGRERRKRIRSGEHYQGRSVIVDKNFVPIIRYLLSYYYYYYYFFNFVISIPPLNSSLNSLLRPNIHIYIK